MESTGRSDLQFLTVLTMLKCMETTTGVSNESVAEITNGESASLGLAIMALANEGDGGSSAQPMITACAPGKLHVTPLGGRHILLV